MQLLECCAACSGILFLTVFATELSASSYQWRCSALDTNNNKYYLPDFGGRTQVMGYREQPSQVNTIYIYEVNNTQLNCSGTVTDVEFCYTPPSSNSANNREVFTLLTLTRQINGIIRVTNSIPISFRPNNRCSSSKCCDIMTLTKQDQFNLPSPNVFLGIRTKSSPNLLGLHFGEYPRLQTQSSYLLAAGQPTVNSTLILSSALMQTLRLMWFHITSNDMTTAADSQTSEPQSTPSASSFPDMTRLSDLTTDGTNTLVPSTTPVTSISSSDNMTTSSNSDTSEPQSISSASSVPNETNLSDVTTEDTYASVSPTTSINDTIPDDQFSNNRTKGNISSTTSSLSSSGSSKPFSKAIPPSSSVMGAPEQSAANSNSTFTVGGVIGTVVVLILFIIVIVLILVILKVYRRKKYYPSKDLGPAITDKIIYNNNKNPAMNNPEYDYSEVGPSATTGMNKTQKTELDNYYSSVPLEDNNIDPQEYDDIYTVPANNVAGLYEQLENMMTDDVTRHNVVLGNLLGSGQFGDVYKGVWERRLDNLDVAVKTLKSSSREDDKVKFLQEAAIMAQFRHPNVVTMYGIVKDGEPVLLVLEMLKKGDLRNYLLSMKTVDGGISSEIDGHELLSYCRQVASGMVYLSNKAFVHRDLAARNILVSDDRICKIADFGMSRDLADETYYVSNGGMIPVKWTAPEALFYKKYSTASDVWSFGAVMYEIWSIGCKPFQNMQNAQVIEMINSGYRLPPPPGCSYAIYSIMMSCWHPEANGRPNFNELSTKLSVSNSKLLHKSEADTSSMATLGADLTHGEGVYESLQKMYVNH